MSLALPPSHSSDVELWLDCDAFGRVELRCVGGAFVEATRPYSIPPCEADLVVKIDGNEQRTRVHVSNGFEPGRLEAVIVRLDAVAPF